MSRYEKDYSIDGWPILDTSTGHVLHTDDIVQRLNEHQELLKEADVYLETNKLTSIGNGSILHQKFKEHADV